MKQALAAALVILLTTVSSTFAQDLPLVADLESCELTSGSEIEDCFVTYRLFGTLNAEKSNAILVPTWFGGKSEHWIPNLGADAFIDTTRYFTIIVDALGNGASSSPSNSESQAGELFPKISIGDMVSSQYRLVTDHLGLNELHAVVGISMGGMQAFEWGVALPDYAKKVVPIVGSPRLGAYDLFLWKAMLESIEQNRDRPDANEAIGSDFAGLFLLAGSTPAQINKIDPGKVDSTWEATKQAAAAIQVDDFASQIQAMIDHDVSRHHDGDMELAAKATTAKMLVIYSPDDHVVTYFPAESFAQMLGAKIVSIPSECGHSVTSCEKESIGEEVRTFLDSGN